MKECLLAEIDPSEVYQKVQIFALRPRSPPFPDEIQTESTYGPRGRDGSGSAALRRQLNRQLTQRGAAAQAAVLPVDGIRLN